MKEWYLVKSFSGNWLYVVKHRWYHQYIGGPANTIDICNAENKQNAETIFLMRNHNFNNYGLRL